MKRILSSLSCFWSWWLHNRNQEENSLEHGNSAGTWAAGAGVQCSLTHLVQCCRTAGSEDTQGIHLSVEADPHLVHTYSINTLSQQKCPRWDSPKAYANKSKASNLRVMTQDTQKRMDPIRQHRRHSKLSCFQGISLVTTNYKKGRQRGEIGTLKKGFRVV